MAALSPRGGAERDCDGAPRRGAPSSWLDRGRAVAQRHRHRKLQGEGRLYTARKDESGVSPDVVSVLALERHWTVGAMARTSTRLRCRSTSPRMSLMTWSVRRWGWRPRSSSLVLAALK